MVKVRRKNNVKDYKKAIVKYVVDHKKKLAKTFDPRQTEEHLAKALDPNNWILEKKTDLHYPYEIVHIFDCKPYKRELKAYVYTTPDESSIENVIVQTE